MQRRGGKDRQGKSEKGVEKKTCEPYKTKTKKPGHSVVLKFEAVGLQEGVKQGVEACFQQGAPTKPYDNIYQGYNRKGKLGYHISQASGFNANQILKKRQEQNAEIQIRQEA